ncbi:MAG: divergent PAP2 family protein [Lachnospiraceae bacterium]|nr:divergent PAP2 family protein [Lachnospiraceae bacterium]
MKDSLWAVFQNRVLLTGLAGWASAQVLKAIIYAIVNKSFDPRRLVGDGGMPSAHSATVVSMAATAGMVSGFDSPLFAVACIFAIIVMHDAMGVRLETGKQAKLLNEMMVVFERMGEVELPFEEKLKELVGHTPLQVLGGGVLGLVVALIAGLLI